MKRKMTWELRMFDTRDDLANNAAYALAHDDHFSEWSRELVIAGIPLWRAAR